MKKIFIIVLFLSSTIGVNNTFAQAEVENAIKEAQGFLKSKNYREAQSSLNEALAELNTLIGKSILATLPTEIGGLKFAADDDAFNSAGMAFLGGGSSISRRYYHPSNSDRDATITIVSNSPMVATVNMFISNPMFASGSNSGGKNVRIGTRKGIQKFDSEYKNGELQLPMGASLITISGNGFKDETDFKTFCEKFDFDKIRIAIGEN
jgi:hypothetical protein